MSVNARIGYCFLALIFLVAVIAGRDGLTTLVAGANKDKVAVGTLREGFDSLPVFPGAVAEGDVRKFDKAVLTSYSRNMYAEGSMDHVMRFYESVMPPLGWGRSTVKKVDGVTRSAKFCKSGVALIVGFVGDARNGVIYGVQMVWDGDANSSLHCPLARESPVAALHL